MQPTHVRQEQNRQNHDDDDGDDDDGDGDGDEWGGWTPVQNPQTPNAC